MCLRPVSIKTNKITYRSGIDKMYYTVPCGDCDECRLQKINDYYVRLYYEWQRYMKNGGSVFFVTMSYNDDSLPHTPAAGSLSESLLNEILSRTDDVLPASELQCFDKGAVRSFLERLHHLDRFPDRLLSGLKYYKRNDDTGKYECQASCFCDNDGVFRNQVLTDDIKHFIVCEYGHETKRPHYHALIFFPFIVSAGAFKRICEFCWSDKVEMKDVPDVIKGIAQSHFDRGIDYVECRDWFCYRSGKQKKRPFFMHKKGFCMYSVKGAQILRPVGMKYLCKYIFKDPEFYKIPHMADYIDTIKRLPSLDSIGTTNSEYYRTLRLYKNTLPFFLLSNNLGTCFVEEIDHTVLEDAQKFVKFNFQFENDEHLYAMPSYFVRRLTKQNKHYVNFFDDKKYFSISYVTEFGKNVLRYKFDDSIKRFIDKVRMVSTSSFRSMFFPSDYLYKENPNTNSLKFDLQEFYDELYSSYLYVDKLRLLAIYRLIYKDVVCFDENLRNNLDVDFWIEQAYNIFENRLDHINDSKDKIFGKYIIRGSQNVIDFNSLTYNHCDIFRDFDYFLYRLECCDNLIRKRNFDISAKRYEESQKYRSLYNSLIYKKAI